MHTDLIFNLSQETNKTVNFLDLQITRGTHNLLINIYRKPTTTDTTIHYTSNHPNEHKTAAYRYHLLRLHSLPLSPEHKQLEWKTIQNMAKSNGFPLKHINRIHQHTKHKINTPAKNNTPTESKTIRTTFTYFSPNIRAITNLFKHTNIQITYKTTNTIQQLLRYTPHKQKTIHERSGIYKLKCNTCNLAYIGQTKRSLQQRYKEHTRYIKHNDPQSAYALHILNNRHEYGTMEDTMTLLKYIPNPTMLLPAEQLFIHSHHYNKQLIQEQQAHDNNPLYRTILDIYDASLKNGVRPQYITDINPSHNQTRDDE